jgi:uncharacterized protein (TIGR02246 family)
MIEHIRQTMMRYATAQDHGNSEAFAGLFAEEAVWERSDGSNMSGRETILAHLQIVTAKRAGSIRHMITTLDIELKDSGEAQAMAYVLVYRTDGANEPQLTAIFDYNTTLVERDGAWVIARHCSQPLK